ncbi:ABC transporter ATP-binding protein [Paenibacillus macquariensis]|uniref:Putative hemin import ATP-binding protein HrtA n=1 Tax=Paenibacillus macquariensis TaxID=948756 RepID=A0ABY1JNU7_9BACL|nr:ABC transporter ATP-binding protein [Paenibacillus macquariensis]MEC0092118.1 ABC transporter ATP-binding protein [Paenibacillus macquariensis]OAB37321.1 hemin ABC transporter ATP-binding protein [Paenibacillus macquariensis subsp. macquariensis]SIQ50796.1 putative ABC transport system ATP-binding protein [Paenibacillus macquariensis]
MTTAKLVMKQVTKTYGDGDSTLSVLNKLDFKVNEGEFVAVLGPSGSGKSTFLSTAGALLSPTSGEILIDGESIADKNKAELTEFRLHKIGFMFQNAQLLPYLKVEEQLLLVARIAKLSPSEAKKRAAYLLKRLGIWERRNHYPEKLSGGEKQRVAIARAWMNNPAILFADEPTASLDFKRGKEVVQMLADEVKSEGKAAVMVTHDERMLEWCDRILYLQDGILVER